MGSNNHRHAHFTIPGSAKFTAFLFTCILATAFIARVPVFASNIEVAGQTASRTIQEIAAKWERVVAPQAGGFNLDSDIFTEVPSVSNPYSYGGLTDAFLTEGLDMLNFTRWLAGLPGDITLDRTLERQQQAASVINAVQDVISHTPVKPSDMSDKFFLLGEKGAATSNLAAGYGTLGGAVRAYLSDSDPFNIDRLGHRRWILNPPMKNTMFGYARTSGGYSYSSMQAFDTSRDMRTLTGYGHVSWPAAGFFPMEFLAADDAWSISLNTDQYDRTRVNDIRVSMVRIRDGKTWTLDGTDTDKSGEFFTVETYGYGIAFCIIFRPAGIGSIQDGDSFSVHVTGLVERTGTVKEIVQDTTFFRLADAVWPAALKILMHPGESLQLRTAIAADGITPNPVRYAVYSGSESAAVSTRGLVQAGVAGYAFIKAKSLSGNLQYIQITVREADPADPVSSWAQAEYDLARVNGLTGGLDQGYRLPVTRLEFASLAVNLCENLMGQPFAAAVEPFSDTDDPAVAKAFQAGIIKGTSPTLFTPAKRITRQEAAVLLMNAERFLMRNPVLAARKAIAATTQTTMATSPFSDDAAIYAWAKADVYGAVAANLLKGGAENLYHPLGYLTREQTFVILQRLYASLEP